MLAYFKDTAPDSGFFSAKNVESQQIRANTEDAQTLHFATQAWRSSTMLIVSGIIDIMDRIDVHGWSLSTGGGCILSLALFGNRAAPRQTDITVLYDILMTYDPPPTV
jgi:hypothetical protein